MVNKHTLYIPPYPHDGGGRFGRTIASGQRFAFLRAAADALFKFPPCPHYGGARSVRTIASGQRFAVLRAAADAAIADCVCFNVLRSKVIRYATFGMC